MNHALHQNTANRDGYRYMRVCITPEDMLSMIDQYSSQDSTYLHKFHFPELPEGYAVRGVTYEPGSHTFDIIIHHPTFEPVELGARIPRHDGTIGMRMISYKKVNDNGTTAVG